MDIRARNERLALWIAFAVAGTAFLVSLPFILSAGFGAEDFLLPPREHAAWGTAVWSYLRHADPEAAFYWRPLTRIVQQTLQTAFGSDAWIFHAWNILLHLAASTLLYQLLIRLSEDRVVAAFAAIAFLVHPTHEDSVIWVSGISGLSESVCHLGGLIAFDRFLSARRSGWGIFTVVCFAGAVLFKESGATMLLTIPLLWIYRSQTWRRLWPWGMMVAFAIIESLWRNNIGVASSIPFASLTENPLGWLRNILFYIVQSVMPVRLVFRAVGFDNYYSLRDALPTVPATLPYISVIVILALAAAGLVAVFWKKLPRYVRFSPVFAVACMGPLLLSRFTGMRLMYLFGGMLMLGLTGVALRVSRNNVVRVLLVVWVALMSAAWIERTEAWHETGDLAGRIFADAERLVLESPHGATLVFRGIPARHLGGFVFPVAFSESLKLRFEPGRVRVYNYDDQHEDISTIPKDAIWYDWRGDRFESTPDPRAAPDIP